MKRSFLPGSRLALLPRALLMLATGSIASQAEASILAPTVTNSATPFPGFAADRAIDQTDTDYASQGQGENTFLEFSFGSSQFLDRIVVINRDSPNASDYIGDFTLTLDGNLTETVFRTPLRGLSQIHPLTRRAVTNLRLDVDTIGAGTTRNTGAMEIIFISTPAGQVQIPGVSILGSATPFSTAYDATNAIDGDVGRTVAPGVTDQTDYASQGLGAATFIDFDLGAQMPVGGFDWIDRIAAADRVLGFSVIFSQNSIFGDADDVVRNYDNSVASKVALGDAFSPINARYVRYDVTAIGAPAANAGASEIVFYRQIPEPSSCAVFCLGIVALSRRRR